MMLMYLSPVIPLVTDTVRRSNTLKICNPTHYDIRKYFCNRITNMWNSLPIDIVTVPTLFRLF